MVVLQRQLLYVQAYETLRDGIASRRYPPGETLDVNALSLELGISRTPIREAVRQLSQEGLVETDRTGHLIVCVESPEQLADIYLLRASLESTSARLLAEASGPLDLSVPEEAVERGRAAVLRGGWEDVARANSDFHESIVALTGSAHMMRLMATIRVHIERQRAMSMKLSERRAASHEGHARILELIRERRADEVQVFAYGHVSDAARWVLRAANAESASDSLIVRTFLTEVEHDDSH